MKFSTLLSLLVAVILAGVAVYGARDWLLGQREILAASLQAELARAQTDEEEEVIPTILVAAEPIQFGERLSVSVVREIEWVGEIRPEGSYETVDDLIVDGSEENARFAITSMAVGEPILASKVTEPGQRAKLSTTLTPGMKAVSIRVNDVLGVAGFVLPGDRVDVMLTRGNFVDVLLQGVRVLAIDQTADERKDNPSVVRTVTFEVNTQEAQKLVLAGNVGQLSLALRNVASSDVEPIDRITIDDLSDFDVADDLLEANLEADAPDPSDERLAELEELLKNLSAGVTEKLDQVESRLEQREPEVQEVVVERIIEVAPPVPEKSTVAVIRNGQRQEYKVEHSDDDTETDGEIGTSSEDEAVSN